MLYGRLAHTSLVGFVNRSDASCRRSSFMMSANRTSVFSEEESVSRRSGCSLRSSSTERTCPARAESSAEDNDWSRSVSSMAYLNKASAIIVFALDTESVIKISCRRPDTKVIAVCDGEIVANQLCLVRGVFPVYTPDLFAQRDFVAVAHDVNIMHGNIVIVDGENVSLQNLD